MRIKISAGPRVFDGVLETDDAPETCAWFVELLPFRSKVIHARWSGEAVWVPLGDLESGIKSENHTVHPSRGDVLFYPGGISEAEILVVYGSAAFSSKVGDLAGNHFITISSDHATLAEFGNDVLWNGAQDIVFEAADETNSR